MIGRGPACTQDECEVRPGSDRATARDRGGGQSAGARHADGVCIGPACGVRPPAAGSCPANPSSTASITAFTSATGPCRHHHRDRHRRCSAHLGRPRPATCTGYGPHNRFVEGNRPKLCQPTGRTALPDVPRRSATPADTPNCVCHSSHSGQINYTEALTCRWLRRDTVFGGSASPTMDDAKSEPAQLSTARKI